MSMVDADESNAAEPPASEPDNQPRRNFFAELKRRQVYRVTVVYGAVAFVVWQVADIIVPALGLPDWILTLAVIGPILTFPFAVVLAWAYELTPDGIRRTSELDAARTSTAGSAAAPRAPGRLLTQRVAIAAVVVVVLVTASWAVLGRRASKQVDLSEMTLAVFPFAVRGSDGLDYLRQGLVDLLSRNLTGALEIRPLDPSLMLRLTGGVEPKSLDEAGAIARRAGAGQFVIGSVSESGGRLRVDASLYQLRDSIITLATKTVQGDTTQLFSLIDQLTAALLAERITGAASQRLIRTAAATTASLPALKAYLEGEQHYRAGEHADAVDAFQRALGEDSTFALARYRLAVSYHMRADHDGARREIELTLRDAARLGPHDRRVAQSFHAYHMGDIPTAERQLRIIIREFPRDLEARVILAELLLTNGSHRGESLKEAKELLVAVLDADPKFTCIFCQISSAATADGDTALYHRAERMYNRSDTTRMSDIGRLRFALLTGDSATANAELRAVVDTATAGAELGDNLDRIAVGAIMYGEFDYAQRVLDHAVARRSDGRYRTLVEATLAIERGQWQRASDLLVDFESRQVMPLDVYAALLFANVPFEMTGRAIDDLAVKLRNLDAGRVAAPADAADAIESANWEERLRPAARQYLLGLASSRIGQPRSAMANADSLELFAAANPDLSGLTLGLAHAVRADVALRRGDAVAALRSLERIDPNLPPVNLALEASDYAVLLRAHAYSSAGEHETALRWLTRGVAWAGWNRPGRATAWNLEMARTLDALGRRAEAASHYAMVADAWKDSDPELRPQLDAARRRLTEMVSER